MVRENSPCFEIPSEITSHGKQSAMKHGEPLAAAEVMHFLVSAGGDDIRAALRQPMSGSVRPWCFRHAWDLPQAVGKRELLEGEIPLSTDESGGGPPQSMTLPRR
jgi:hypothetical protein